MSTPKGTTMHFTSELRHPDGLLERAFTLGDIPGILWTPASASASQPAPLLLLGHPGGLHSLHPRLLGRARSAAASGIAAAAIELPGTGARLPSAVLDRARADLRAAIHAGVAPSPELVDRLILPLVDEAVPEWQQTIDAVLELPEVRGPVGCSGGVIAIGTRLAIVEPRIVAAVLFAGSFVPRSIIAAASRVTIPVHVLLQWDDENNDRQMALDLFDALGSRGKTLVANTGGHMGVPASAGEGADRFLADHLLRPVA